MASTLQVRSGAMHTNQEFLVPGSLRTGKPAHWEARVEIEAVAHRGTPSCRLGRQEGTGGGRAVEPRQMHPISSGRGEFGNKCPCEFDLGSTVGRLILSMSR